MLGYMIRGPIGGMAWHHLQYVLGLSKLGYDVWFLEDSDDYESCYDPDTHQMGVDPSYGLRFVDRVFRMLGIGDRWAYHDAHTSTWHGPAAPRALELCRSADLLLNLSAVNPLRDWTREVPVRALIDTDPAFTQVKHLTDPGSREQASEHTAFFSFGENMGMRDCTLPDDGFPWRPTRQPIVLDAWTASSGRETGAFTTVMQWDSYAVREFAGQRFGMKSMSFDTILDIPKLVPHETFEIAVGSPSAPRDLLRDHGWLLRDPIETTRDPWTYQRYLAESKAEFTVAKHGYVISNSGWFSERSAAYLASGRPVITQETGFSAWLPTGRGVLSFRTEGDALAAIADVSARYQEHCNAARELAEEYFDSRKILSHLVQEAMEASPRG